MRGYKGMNKDMTCRGMQYAVGESYHFDGDIKICKKGFHFCENLCDVFKYYVFSESRFFEIEANGEMITRGDKTVTSDITILRELKEIEVNRGFYYGDSNSYSYGDGYSDGNGNGDGYSYGNGNGYGDGYGYGNSNGNGYGYGNGNGNGYGYGNGNGIGIDIHRVLI